MPNPCRRWNRKRSNRTAARSHRGSRQSESFWPLFSKRDSPVRGNVAKRQKGARLWKRVGRRGKTPARVPRDAGKDFTKTRLTAFLSAGIIKGVEKGVVSSRVVNITAAVGRKGPAPGGTRRFSPVLSVTRLFDSSRRGGMLPEGLFYCPGKRPPAPPPVKIRARPHKRPRGEEK